MEKNQSRTIIFSSITGMIIKHEQTESASVSFNLSEYPTGLYVVSVIQEGSLFSQKFIIY